MEKSSLESKGKHNGDDVDLEVTVPDLYLKLENNIVVLGRLC